MRAITSLLSLILATCVASATSFAAYPPARSLCEQVLISVVESRALPSDHTRNSLALLLDSALAIYQATSTQVAVPTDPSQLMEFTASGALVLSPLLPATVIAAHSGRVLPVHALFILQANVEKALQVTFNLSSQSLRTFGVLIHRVALQAFGLGVREYRALLRSSGVTEDLLNAYMPEVLLSSSVRDAVDELQWVVHVDRSYDIPFLAGYAADNPRLIFIDRSIPQKYKLRSRVEFDATPFLVVHEAVEKALLDFLKLKDRAYIRTHQIAQQLEKAAVLAYGLPWQEYQYDIMEPVIDKILRKTPSRVPVGLDLTPYIQEKAFQLMKEMRTAFVSHSWPFTLTGEVVNYMSTAQAQVPVARVSTPLPGVVHFYFEHQDEMASLFMRFQEYFESPRFSGRIFTRADFIRWYKSQNNNEFKYFEEWDGFNFSLNNLNAFYRGDFKDLINEESAFLNFLKPLQNNSYYIIATARSSHPSTLPHELSHALYKINPEYRQSVQRLMVQYDLSAVRSYLASTGGYGAAVLEDEAHAWLMNNSEDLREGGVDIAPLQELVTALQGLIKKYISR